jgi:MFS transporter, OPA family, sugar phosphate sensor protein UhpC
VLGRIVDFYRSGPDAPPLLDPDRVRNLYTRMRWQVFLGLTLGYGLFYTCRLSLSIAKKPMLDAGVFDARLMGIIGASLLVVNGLGRFTNGFLSDHANIRRFMSTGLLVSAVANLLLGFTESFWLFLGLWMVNGWFQSMGSAPSTVSLCQWFSNRERGTWYGIWCGSDHIGEAISFLGTAALVSYAGWQWGFWGPGLLCLVAALVLFRVLADRPQAYGLPHVAAWRQDDSAGPPHVAESVADLQKEALRTPAVWVLGLAAAMMYVARYAVMSWGVMFLQVAKGWSLVEAGSILTAFPILGYVGASTCGLFSDRVFGGDRNRPTLIYGLLSVASLAGLWKVPPGHYAWDLLCMGGFGLAIGALIVFLGGLTAIDLCPKRAAGAVKGIVGLFAYAGAALQDVVSGAVLESGKTLVDGQPAYDFDAIFPWWIGASVLSIVLAASVWRAGRKE